MHRLRCLLALGAFTVAMSTAAVAQQATKTLDSAYCQSFVTNVAKDLCSESQSHAILTPEVLPHTAERQPGSASASTEEANASEFPWSDVIASIALGVSLLTAAISQLHFGRARKRSIRDDFWVRQVTYPYILQPALEMIEWCSTVLPLPHMAAPQDATRIKDEFQVKRRALLGRIGMLPALELPPTLYRRIAVKLQQACNRQVNSKDGAFVADVLTTCIEKIEDHMIVYLGEVSTGEATSKQFYTAVAGVQRQAGLMVNSVGQWQHDM